MKATWNPLRIDFVQVAGRANFRLLTLTYTLDMLGYALAIPVLSQVILSATGFHGLAGTSLGGRNLVLGLLLGTFGVAQLVAAPIIGGIADRFGRRTAFIITLTLDTLSQLWLALSIATGWMLGLFVARACTGLSSGNFGLALGTAADLAEDERRASAFSYVIGVSTVGFLVGPILGGILLHWSDSGAVPFFLVSVLKVLNLVLMVVWFRETLLPAQRIRSLRMSLGAVFTALRGRVAWLLFSFAAFYLGWNMFLQFQPSFYIAVLNATGLEIGLFYAQLSIFWGIGSLVVNRLLLSVLTLRGHSIVMQTTIGLLLVGFYLISQAWQAAVVVAGLGLCAGMFFPNGNVLLSKRASLAVQGKLLGVNQGLWSVGQIVGPVLAGAIATVNVAFSLAGAGLIVLVGTIGMVAFRDTSGP